MGKKIKLLNPDVSLSECHKLIDIFRNRGYDITIEQAQFLWEKYSTEMLNGWLCYVASDDQIFKSLSLYWKEIK